MFILFKKDAIKELKQRLKDADDYYENNCKIARGLKITNYESKHDAVYQRGIISGLEQAIRTLENL